VSAYYNEFDPRAAEWLRELIRGGYVAKGEVDTRDIRDVCADDLRGFKQHHFFAGIGIWSYALRLSGWPDDKPVWTGSCPCQPFSAAGKRKKYDDERHLWPAWLWLIRQSRPGVIFGEQVAGRDGIDWVDFVSTDLEAEGYAVAPTVLPACGVGAPHIRQRTWIVADTMFSRRPEGWPESGIGSPAWRSSTGNVADSADIGRIGRGSGETVEGKIELERSRDAVSLADADGERRPSRSNRSAETGRQVESIRGASADRHSDPCGVANTDGGDTSAEREQRSGEHGLITQDGGTGDRGFWSDAEWIFCRDGKYRPVEPGTFPLAHGAAGRMGRLRGYGNGIVPEVAAEVIKAYVEIRAEQTSDRGRSRGLTET